MSNIKWKPEAGGIYRCISQSKFSGARKGEHWVYSGDGEAKKFGKRSVTLLLNGFDVLDEAGRFVPAEICPFCFERLFEEASEARNVCGCGGLCDSGHPCPMGHTEIVKWWKLLHDGHECARVWDAKVKRYCRDCSGDTMDGKCPKCAAGDTKCTN